MTGFEGFDRLIKVATEGLSPEAVSAELARFAKAELAAAIARGEATSFYTRYVNGRQGLPETAVEAPGPIVYVFSNWSVIIEEALAQLVKLSPKKSGRYARSYIVIVGGRIATDYQSIPPEAEVIITNFQPYVRKVQVGFKMGEKKGKMVYSLPPRLFDRARTALFRRFPQSYLSAQVRFLDLPTGIHAEIPYILKGGQKVRAVKADRRSSAFRAGRATLSPRRDREAGKPITYPSLVLNMVM